jgi:hypothetical protein
VIGLHGQVPGESLAIKFQPIISAAVSNIKYMNRLVPAREWMTQTQLLYFDFSPTRPSELQRTAGMVAMPKDGNDLNRFIQESFIVHIKNPLKVF